MRDLATKVDSSSNLNAGEFNSSQNELENAVTRAGITLDAAAGPDTDAFMLARAILLNAIGGISYQDGGAANSFVLTAVQTFEQPTAYFDGMTVNFKAAATNTGACTINVEAIGAVDFTKAGGTAFASGEIVAGNIITARYFSGNNRFEEVANTTPLASGPAAPDQVAVYNDTGTVSQITLTIEPGYNQPSAFTDQMVILFKAAATNDGSGTHPVNITGLGIKNLLEKDGTNPVAGRIKADDWVMAAFREVRDAFEIAFVYEDPQPGAIVPVTVGSSSGVIYNLDILPENRPPLAYFDGFTVVFRAPQDNTGALDINVAGLGAKSMRTPTGGLLSGGEIRQDAFVIAQYELGLDRFRFFSSADFAAIRDLQENRGTRSVSVQQGSIAVNTAVNLNWNTPVFDDLGFYDAGNDNFVVPAGVGVSRIDIAAYADMPISTTQRINLSIALNGAVIAANGNTTIGGVPNAGVNVTAMEIGVSPGDVIEATLSVAGGAGTVAITRAQISIRVSKFAL